MTNKYKDKTPEETISLFKEKLEELGFSFSENVQKVTENIYWVKLTDPFHNNFQTYGKGTTPEYAVASAYGEAIERVQCLWFNKAVNWKNTSKNIFEDFIYSPEEKYFTGTELLEKFPLLSKDLEQKIHYSVLSSSVVSNSLSSYLENFKKEKHPCVKFSYYNSNNQEYLPLESIYLLQGSTGMCSGNTESEALIQGLSEIFERWVEEYIYENKLTPPEISFDYIETHYPQICNLIKEVKNSQGYDSYVYDCSLGKNVPVVCVVFVDKETLTYKKSFGAHPRMEIALERCFTEALQSCALKEEAQKNCNTVYMSSFLEEKWNTQSQYEGRYNTHTGSIPYTMFYAVPSWRFRPWGNEDTPYTNDTAWEDLKEVCRALKWDLFYRDFSFLGVPSYYIYIPGVSSSKRSFDDLCDSSLYRDSFIKSIKNKQPLSTSSKELIMNLLERDLLHTDVIGNWVDQNTILLSLYVEFRKFNEAQLLIRKVFNYSRTFLCLEKELELRELGISKENRDSILSKFFEERYVEHIRRFWRGENIYLKLVPPDHLLPCFKEYSPERDIIYKEEAKDSNVSTFKVCKNIKEKILQYYSSKD